jgi:hypothetical protein
MSSVDQRQYRQNVVPELSLTQDAKELTLVIDAFQPTDRTACKICRLLVEGIRKRSAHAVNN